MRPASEIIAPHQGCLASRKDTLRLVHVAYLVFHNKARAPDSDDSYPNLDGIRTHQRQQIGTGNFFDEHTIMMPIGACLNARIVRGVGNNTFCLLMFLARRPLLQPQMELVKIVESCFLLFTWARGSRSRKRICTGHQSENSSLIISPSFLRIVHMRQGIKITEADLHRIQVRKIFTHRVIALSFFLHALLTLDSNRTGFLKTIALRLSSASAI